MKNKIKDKVHFLSTEFGSRIFGLDIMRAAAILMVVCSHSIPLLSPYYPILGYLGIGGFFGVEMFFVLSGFLIGHILIRQIHQHTFTLDSIIHFWTRRWFRTLPNYFMILLVNIGLLLILGEHINFSILPYFLFMQNFKQPNPPLFPESWSLSIEEWFYLLIPIMLLLINKVYNSGDKKIVIKTTLLIFLVLPLLYRFYQGISLASPSTIEVWDNYIRKIVAARLDALMFGVSMAYIKFYHHSIFYKFRNIMFVLGCMVVTGCFYLYFHSQINLYFETVYFNCVSFGFALLIPYLNSIKTGPRVIVLPLTFISIISYSMYVLHWSLIMNPLKRYVTASNLHEAGLLFAGYWILTIGLSAILYSFYERPMTELRERFAPFTA